MVNSQSIQLLQNAVHYFQQGDSDTAEQALYRLTKKQKKIPLSWFLLATIHLQNKEYAKAIDEYRKAINLQPDYPDAYNNLGVAYEAINESERAKKSYKMAITQNPNYANALFNLANIFQHEEAHDRAIEHYKLALIQDPNYIKALNNIALVYQSLQRYDEAISYYQSAQNLAENDADINSNLGHCYHCKGEYQSAIQQYESGLIISPDKAEIYNNLAITYQEIEDDTKAVKYFEMAISIRSDYVEAITNLANYYRGQNNLAQATKLYQRALTIDSTYVEANNNYGLLLYADGKYDEAASYFTNAISSTSKHDEAEYNLSTYFLASGNFLKGWEGYHARPTIRSSFSQNIKKLNINSVRNKSILLIKEQGIGDELFFLRFAEQLSEVTEKIGVYTSKKISFCVEQLPYINAVYTDSLSTHSTQYDHCLSMGDLPRLLVTGNNAVPPSVSLCATRDNIGRVRNILHGFGPPPYIGFTWQGGQAVNNFLFKNIPVENIWGAIKHFPGTLINIQRNPTTEELEILDKLSSNRKIIDLSSFNDELPLMLALLTILDSYIGVSNTNMHLRQAVGKSAHVLVPHPPEWRWKFAGQSPWFPEFQIFRQSIDGSWDAALSALRKTMEQNIG